MIVGAGEIARGALVAGSGHVSHGDPGNVGQQWKVWPKGTRDFGSASKKSGKRTTLDGDGNIIGN